MAVFEFFVGTGSFFNLVLIKKYRNVAFAENFILFGMILLLTVVLIHGGYHKTGIYWIYTFPLIAFFLKGNNSGLLWNFVFFSVVGILTLFNKLGYVSIAYTFDELRQALLAYVIVMVLAYIFEDALLKSYREVSKMAITDQLTGLFNRRFILRKLEEEIERAKRYGNSLCVILLDIDNFKSINDKYGHDVGDFVLKKVAQLIIENTRNVDTIGRLGGEEFVVICPETDRNGGYIVAEKIRKSIEGFEMIGLPKISISAGISSFTGKENPAQMLKKADIALYRAKKTGKNKVVLYNDIKIYSPKPLSEHKTKKPAP